MKQALTKLALIISISATVVGCSSNTQNQNTGLGAITGGVLGGLAGGAIGGSGGAVAAGAVVGGLLGGIVGYNMESSDSARTYTAMNKNRENQPAAWRNSKTGNSYRVVPTGKRMTVHGNPNCRRFVATAVIKGKRRQVHGVACRQSNGTWKAVSSR